MLELLFARWGIEDWIGILGSLLLAGSYFAISTKRISAERPMFHVFNLVGASLILYSLLYRPNAGAMLIEVVWITIAVYSLIRISRSRGKQVDVKGE